MFLVSNFTCLKAIVLLISAGRCYSHVVHPSLIHLDFGDDEIEFSHFGPLARTHIQYGSLGSHHCICSCGPLEHTKDHGENVHIDGEPVLNLHRCGTLRSLMRMTFRVKTLDHTMDCYVKVTE